MAFHSIKISFIIVLVGLFSADFAFASIVINEIAWMGSKIEGVESKNWWRYEWLELYSNTSDQISLDGWKIELFRTDLDWSLDLKGNINPHHYFLIVASDKIPNYDLNYSNLGGKFNNSGQKVVLKNNLGEIIETIDCFSSGQWFAGDNTTKQTMERKNPQAPGNNSDNWGISLNPNGTPKAENSVKLAVQSSPQPQAKPTSLPELESEPKPEPEPSQEPANQASTTTSDTAVQLESKTPEDQQQKEPSAQLAPETQPITYASGIVISEILPSPEGPDETEEWIELKNLNQKEIDLSQWKIQDTTGSLTTYTVPEGTKIGPDGFLVLSRPVTKITLNNSGDGLALLQPNGNILDKVIYAQAPLGQSYNRLVQDWQWSNVLTPGRDNVLPPTINSKEVSKKEASAKNGTSTTPQELENSLSPLAAIGEQIPKPSRLLLVLLIASGIAVFSGIIIIFLKRILKGT